MGRDVINALIDSIFESLREDLTQQFLSLPCEIKKDILHSIQEVLASSPDGSNLLARSEEPILISPRKSLRFSEMVEACGQRLKSCKGNLRPSLVSLFAGVGSMENLHAAILQ